jgi:16S rRNA (cytosine1402-N4)-methyltransferase
MHVPVLLQEVIDNLSFKESDKFFLDATVGGAGHSKAVCKSFPHIEVLGLDADEEAVEIAKGNLSELGCQFRLKVKNFKDLTEALKDWQVKSVDKILFDLGMSTMQLETSGRGFSFRRDEPLIMTFGGEWKNKLTAFEIVNHWHRPEIEKVLKNFGEELFARRIAEAIVEERKVYPIRTTSELVKIIERAVPRRYQRIHPATKSFQALRMVVNNELEVLESGLESAWSVLKEGGRIAVIAFHSLEDRVVKNFFRDLSKESKAILITKKPVRGIVF